MVSAGHNLRALRDQLGLTMRDVENASQRIADKHRNEEFAIPPSRLSDIETKGITPSIYRLYSLAIIYRRDPRDLLALYGIDYSQSASDLSLSTPPRSHVSTAFETVTSLQIPAKLDPSFDLRKTSNLGRMVEKWGVVPMAYLNQLAHQDYTYGYVGSEDFTMYPLLPPGTFVQVDESRNRVVEGVWRSEYERPIYFVETREGHVCCWCALNRDSIILQPHPLSPAPLRVLKHPQDAEVLGQVVGMAMRLGEWHHLDAVPEPRERTALN
ncbi:MAG TPA: helix-turn-helix transcriptional regulator [Terriglobales bacterium]|nr:helix-turn-helix transcriptional regulator [Terriglobales bacterium]